MQSESHFPASDHDLRPYEPGVRVISVGSAAADELERELRDSLLAALADGAREIVLDLQGVDTITSGARGLLEAVGATIADRGGVLLVLTGGREDGKPCVMREIRGTARDRWQNGEPVAGQSTEHL